MNVLTFEKALKGSRAYGLLMSDLKTGLGHAYIVASGDDDVVDEFFTLVAASVYCENGNSACFECAECRKVLHRNHADVFHINEARDKIKVDDVAKLVASVYVKSLSDRKLYFIHRADLMNAQAQNKLLKTLEEPPQDVTIFLGVANSAAMLDTIKSRARTLHLDVFDEDTVFEAMLALGYDREMSSVAAACSEGMLGKARKIASSPQYAQLYRAALDLMKRLDKSTDILSLDGLAAGQEDMSGFLDVLSIIIRDMLIVQEDESMILSKHVSQDIKELAQKYSPLALAKIISIINDTRRQLSLNVSPLSAIDNLLFSILEVRHKCPKS